MDEEITEEVQPFVSVDEAKGYLRVDFDDDDALIAEFIDTSVKLCADAARTTPLQLAKKRCAKVAVLYAVAYLYEHREEADFASLSISLRSLLASVRRSVF